MMNRPLTRYSLTIVVEYSDEDDFTLMELESDQPFLSVQAGDRIWAKGFKPGGLDRPNKPHLYDGDLTVRYVRHLIWEFSEGDQPMLRNGMQIVVQDPYDTE